MLICIISDTHSKHKHLRNLPQADIIIHCGDITSMGYEYEIRNFLQWFNKLDYAYKIFIAGNHDWLFENKSLLAKQLIPRGIIYLEDSGVEINGIKFWGSPVSKPFNNWAFNRPEEKLAEHWKAIPDDTDVLITHTPPYGIFDWSVYDNIHTGSESLYFEIVNRLKLKYACWGHIHSGYGIKTIENTTFINASNLDEKYNCVNEPILINI
jgi:Icc-related predicted phosphoesterase